MFDDIKAQYIHYNNWVMDFKGNADVAKRLMRLFSHNREFNSKPEHEAFFKSVEELAGNTLAAAREEGTDVYELIHYVFIDCYRIAVRSTTFMFFAAERIFIPFLDLLTDEELVQLEQEYKKQRRKDPGLPVQTQIKKRIRELCKQRTGV